jgi:hypothetical protein
MHQEVTMPLIQRRTIQGEPIHVGQKEIVPEAQVTWFTRRSGTVGMNGTSGWGVGAVNVRPTALIERGPGFTRRIPIRDETRRLLMGLVAGAVFVVFLAQIAERLARKK